MKAVVIYYSYEGNTALIAKSMASTLDCPIVRLQPLHEMNATGFAKYVWGGKQVVMKECPRLQPILLDLSQFDTVFLGTPVWSWTYAPAIRTIFHEQLLVNKKIYFFCTHEGGIKGVEDKARSLITKNNQWMGFKGFLNVHQAPDLRVLEARTWITSLQSIVNHERKGE